MSLRIFVEGPLEGDHAWVDAFPHASWQPYLSLRADNADVLEQYGGNWGARRIAEYLATRPRHLRSIKLGWLGSGWLKHVSRKAEHDHDREYTTTEKILQAARAWKIDVGHVAGKMRAAMQALADAQATQGLFPYFELEDELFLQSADLTDAMLADPAILRNIETFGGALVKDATPQEIKAALNFETWTDRAKAIRAPFIIAGRRLVAMTVNRLLRSVPRAYRGIGSFVCSNCATFQAKDMNGHRLPPVETIVARHIDMVYLHQPDGQRFASGETALADAVRVLKESARQELCVNVHAGNLTGDEMAWRLAMAGMNGTPQIIFADNPVKTRPAIERALELTKGM